MVSSAHNQCYTATELGDWRGFNFFVDHTFGTNCHMTWERVMKLIEF